MKEGYFQNKIAEFSEKLQAFEHRLKMADTEYERYQKQLGDFKQLLKKLQKIEEFQIKAIDKIAHENAESINKVVTDLKDITEKKIETLIKKKTSVMEKTMQTIQNDAKIFQESLQQIQEFKKELLYYEEFQRLLMLKLINKGILNHRELQEVELRAKKRVR